MPSGVALAPPQTRTGSFALTKGVIPPYALVCLCGGYHERTCHSGHSGRYEPVERNEPSDRNGRNGSMSVGTAMTSA